MEFSELAFLIKLKKIIKKIAKFNKIS